MSLRFYRRVSLIPGLRLNASRGGLIRRPQEAPAQKARVGRPGFRIPQRGHASASA